MVFWIFVIMFFVGLGLKCIGTIIYKRRRERELWFYECPMEGFGFGVSLFSVVVVLIMAFIISLSHIGADGVVAENRERYKILTYKVESGACRDEFGLLNKSVIDEVQEWNEDVVYHKTMQNDFWVGIFFPDIFDEFETIDYTKYANE